MPRSSRRGDEAAAARRGGIEVPARFDGDDRVGVDDVLDAAAAAWSGRRWLAGQAIEFPIESTDRDASGRTIRIVA
jgi:hypothetical protein